MRFAKFPILVKLRLLLLNKRQIPGYFILLLSIVGLVKTIQESNSINLTSNSSASNPMDMISILSVLIILGLIILIIPTYKRYKMLRLLETESESISCALKGKWHFLPIFLIKFIKLFFLGFFPVYCSYEFEYSINGENHRIFKVALDNGDFVEGDTYNIIVNSEKMDEGYIIELLPFKIRYYLNE